MASKETKSSMTESEIRHYQRLLLALKRRLGADLTALEAEALHATGGEASGGFSNVPTHPADLGTDAYEEEIDLSLLEKKDQILLEINDALERLEQKTFGRCEECGQAIPEKRLEALPYARYCVRDAKRFQDQSGA
jgi:RNA polymerase-binding transcription factor DksA